MLALAEILGLIVLNALLHAAFTRWKAARRTGSAQRRARRRVVLHYPLHPSPAAGAPRGDGIDW